MNLTLLEFDYVNHRGEPHKYVVRPLRLEFTPIVPVDGTVNTTAWRIRADVVTRDGEIRPGQRSFLVTGMQNVVERQDVP